MVLSRKDKETERLARGVAALSRETMTLAVRTAPDERLAREQRRRGRTRGLAERLREVGEHCARLPDYDWRPPDEIVGYDENGVWR